ncbi:MAG: baseplate J/gp47 family protein [Methanobacterium sp. ERen5]|nr:MAG: baseplate J/gp47 family protein [Methanobacterium sp. ERen5]
MPIEEQRFIDINGAENLLSEEIDELKEWIVNQEYEGLNTVTDFTEGAMNYFLLCYAATSKFDLKNFADELIRLAFLNSSKGEFLERLTARNGIFRIPGEYSTTMLKFTLAEALQFDVKIDAGTEFGTDEAILFSLIEDKVIPKGETVVYAKIQCQEMGIVGNVKAGTIINIFTEQNIDMTVTNESDVTDGKDDESDDSLRQRASNPSVGTDLWIEEVAETLVSDASCYNLEQSIKLLVYKPTTDVVKQDLVDLFQQKMYRTRNTVIIEEAKPFPVIDTDKSITLVIKDGHVSGTVINIVKNRITNYVNKLSVGGLFKEMCIKYLCESTDGVLYAYLTGYQDVDLLNDQYATITDDLNITTGGPS